MKKICELAVVSRKSVKGSTICRFEAKSKTEESLGFAEVALQKEDTKGGIYFRYVPNQDADAKKAISIIEIQAENQKMVTDILQQLKDEIIKKSISEFSGDGFSKIMTTLVVIRCVNAEKGRIELLDDFEVNITNEMISKYLNDEWLGVEGRYDKEVFDKIDKLIEKEQAKEKEKMNKELEGLRKHLNDILKDE